MSTHLQCTEKRRPEYYCGSLCAKIQTLFEISILDNLISYCGGIYNIGYHRFWKSCLKILGVKTPSNLFLYLAQKDKERMGKFFRAHEIKNKRKRAREKNEKQIALARKQVADLCAKQSYCPTVGWDDKDNNTLTRTEIFDYKYSMYECIVTLANKRHKTSRSKWCKYNGATAAERKALIPKWCAANNVDCI